MPLLYWYNILILLALLLSFICLFMKQLPDKNIHTVIFIIVFLVAATELTGRYMSINSINNSRVYNVGSGNLVTLTFLYFFSLVFADKKVNRFLWLAAISFIAFSLVNTFFIQPINFLQTYTYIFGSLIIITCCIYFFYEIIYKNKYVTQNLLLLPIFWIVCFVFFYYSSSFLFISSIKLMYDMDHGLMSQLFTLNKILAVIFYLTLGAVFYIPVLFSPSQQYVSKLDRLNAD